MSYKGLPERLVSRVNPADARAYAAAVGWVRAHTVNGKVAVYNRSDSELAQLLIPLDATLSDYSRRMAEVVESLAEHLRRDDFRHLASLAVALRPAREPRPSHFIALVDGLFGSPTDDGRVSGEVHLLVFDGEEGSVKARSLLSADDYHRAWQAHGTARYVSFTGILKSAGRARRIENVANFELLNA